MIIIIFVKSKSECILYVFLYFLKSADNLLLKVSGFSSQNHLVRFGASPFSKKSLVQVAQLLQESTIWTDGASRP